MPRMPQGIASDHWAPREWFPALTFAVALALPSLAGADVLVKQKTVSEGLGGFGNASTEGLLVVSGDRSRSEDLVTYTGRFKSLAGGKPKQSISITRLDKELMWSLDPEKQQYSELTFADMRAMMAKGAEQAAANEGTSGPQDEGMTFSVEVKRTGAKQDVNGFPCEQVVITCTGKPTDPKQAESVSEIRMTMDQWMTRKAPGQAEMAAYHRALAEKLGRDAGLAHMADAARAMYGKGMKELTGKLKDLEGIPIRSTFTIESVMPQAQQTADAQKDVEKALADAEHEKAARAERAEQEKQEDAADAKSAGSSIAGGGGFGGALGGFLGKKASKAAARKASAAAEAQAASAAGTPSTGGPTFKSVTEVLSISTDAVPAASFEVPAGYSRQKK